LGKVHGGGGRGALVGGVIHGPTALQTQGNPGRGGRRGRPLSHEHMTSKDSVVGGRASITSVS
jgi:hypothetical protein